MVTDVNPMNETTAVAVIDETKVSTIALVNEARAIKILTFQDRVYAEDHSQNLKTASDKWDALTGPAKAKSYEAYQAALRLHDDLIKELDGARKELKQKCIGFDTEQERLRREEQRRLEEEARKQAEDEQISAAIAAEAEGDTASAQAIIDEPVYVPPVSVPKAPVQPSRLTAGRSVWSAEVLNLMELVKAVATGTAPITFILANEVALNQTARAMKSAMKVPGVRAVEKKV